MLNKKKKREDKDKYLTAQKIVKNYREKQKSHSVFKRKIYSRNKKNTDYEEEKEGTPIAVIRISG